MDINSSAASVFHFWEYNIVNDTFLPYMEEYGITSQDGLYNISFFLGSDVTYHGPLMEDLVNWTINSPDSTYFNNPLNGNVENFSSLALHAFNQTINELNKKYGTISSKWDWGNIHKRYLSSFFSINTLNTEEIPAAGNGNTINAAYGLTSNFGPSWRLVVNLSNPAKSVGIYPGGVSENPLSSYYSNNFIPWNNGVYYTLIPVNMPEQFYHGYGGQK